MIINIFQSILKSFKPSHGLAHGVGVQLRNKKCLMPHLLLFLIIRKTNSIETWQNKTLIYVHQKGELLVLNEVYIEEI